MEAMGGSAMRCEDARGAIPLFVDGELETARPLEEHLVYLLLLGLGQLVPINQTVDETFGTYDNTRLWAVQAAKLEEPLGIGLHPVHATLVRSRLPPPDRDCRLHFDPGTPNTTSSGIDRRTAEQPAPPEVQIHAYRLARRLPERTANRCISMGAG